MSTVVKPNKLKQIIRNFKKSINIDKKYYKIQYIMDSNANDVYLVLQQKVIRPFEADYECDTTFATLSSDPFIFDPDDIVIRNEIYKIVNGKPKFIKTYMCLSYKFDLDNVLKSDDGMDVNDYIEHITDIDCLFGRLIRTSNDNYFYKTDKHNNSVYLFVYYVTVPFNQSKWNYWRCLDGNKFRYIDNSEAIITTEIYDVTSNFDTSENALITLLTDVYDDANLIAILHNRLNISFNELEKIKEKYDNTKTVIIIEN
jgi:hypothetical protein